MKERKSIKNRKISDRLEKKLKEKKTKLYENNNFLTRSQIWSTKLTFLYDQTKCLFKS